MKKISWSIGCLVLFLLSSLLTACGGVHDESLIYAEDRITGETASISLAAHDTADFGYYTDFTSPLGFNEMVQELRTKKNIVSVTGIDYAYVQLKTDSGEFYLRYNGPSDDEFRYSFFAEAGRASNAGEYVYIPFHMLEWFEGQDCPATATPFEGEVYYGSHEYSFDDFAAYYESKGIYTVKRLYGIKLLITDDKSGYEFYIVLTDYDDYGQFVIHEEPNE